MTIRIIPMSSANPEFIGKDINEVQNDFFEGTLKKDNATLSWYYYEKSGIDAEENDLVLFQMDNCIIASAILDNVIHFHENAADSNRGAYILKTNTIKTFKPISKDELKEYIQDFTSFNQVKQKLILSDDKKELFDSRMTMK